MSRKFPRPLGFHWDSKEPVLGSNGRPSCRNCKGDVTPPKRAWCDDLACKENWLLRVSGQAGCRAICWARDRGVCSACGLDTGAVEREYADACSAAFRAELDRLVGDTSGLHHATVRALRYRHSSEAERRARICPEGVRIADRHGVPWKRLIDHRALWEAHHVTPIVEGGDHFDPGNIVTMCILCHKAETAKLAGRRAKSRGAKRS